MKDDEARYLIDQFNKYASWRPRLGEMGLVGTALIVSLTAITVSLFGYLGRFQNVVDVIDIVWVSLMGFGTTVAVVAVSWRLRSISREHISYAKRLAALEDYRSKHRSLPDSVTFRLVVESKPDQLEKLLKESVPNPKQLPQT